MKTRNGFVSNSSSSSFVVLFPRVPETVAEMELLLFENELYVGYDKKYSTKEIAFAVLQDMKDGVIKNRKALLKALTIGSLEPSEEALKHGFSERCPEWNFRAYNTQAALRKFLDGRLKQKDDLATIVTKKLLKIAKLNQLFKFHYSDNDGSDLMAFMEHGEIFKKLIHFRMNCH